MKIPFPQIKVRNGITDSVVYVFELHTITPILFLRCVWFVMIDFFHLLKMSLSYGNNNHYSDGRPVGRSDHVNQPILCPSCFSFFCLQIPMITTICATDPFNIQHTENLKEKNSNSDSCAAV